MKRTIPLQPSPGLLVRGLLILMMLTGFVLSPQTNSLAAEAQTGVQNAPVLQTSTPVFINEIHYDNADTDVDEGVEVAGPAGTNLAGWQLVPYNGNGGALYSALTLSGIIPDLQNGYGTIFFEISGLQNGSPDGIALVDASNNVIQFLSYEGPVLVTAADGPAVGMTSTDIGVSESSATPIGYSLQLYGVGTVYEDFSWIQAAASTYNAVNNDQYFGTSPSVDITLSKTGPQYAPNGSRTTYTLQVENTGEELVEGIQLTDTLPPGASFILDDTNLVCPACSLGAVGDLVWTVGDLAPGEGVTIHLTVQLPVVATDYSAVVNTAEVTSTTAGEYTSNNTAEASIIMVPMVSIYDLQYVSDPAADDDSLYDGKMVFVRGIVTAETGEVNGYMYIQNGAGPWNGIMVYSGGQISALDAPEGADIVLLGSVMEYNGVTELNVHGYYDYFFIHSYDNPLPEAQVIATGDFINPAQAEAYESVLIKFQAVEVTGLLTYGEYTVDDGSGGAVIDDGGAADGDLTYLPTVGDEIHSLQGIGYFSYSAYKALPRYGADIQMGEVSIEKYAEALVQPGGLLTYTLTVENATAATLEEIYIIDEIPDNAILAEILDGGYEDGSGSVFWGIPSLASKASLSVQFVVTATETADSVIVNDYYLVNASNYVTPTFGAPVTTLVADHFSIHHIQGSTDVSPYAGQTVSEVPGVVTRVNTDGFFLQEPEPDSSPLTSEGIFVYTGTAAKPAVGETLSLSGLVNEYYGLTQIKNATWAVTGADTIIPTTLSLPAAEGEALEPYEGMLVAIPETLTVSQNYFQSRYGQLTLSSEGRLYNPNNGNGLGDTWDGNPLRMLVLDDGSHLQNPTTVPYLTLPDGSYLRAGDTVDGLTGVIDYGLITNTNDSHYRLHPTVDPVFASTNPRTVTPVEVGGSLRIASFNVLNYFNGDGLGGGFPTSRGADTLSEFVRQRDKIIAALVAIDADVIGLMEIENDGGGVTSAVQDLVNGLNEIAGAGTYAPLVGPAPGTDEIQVAFIYKPAKVSLVGSPQNYQVDSYTYNEILYEPLYDRPPLAQTFTSSLTGETFTIIVNHFKSKGCGDATGLDADQGDGEGCWSNKRSAQAEEMLAFIDELQTSSGDDDVIVIGDLNAYGQENPIDVLTTGGLLDQLAQHVPAEERYTYIFDGYAGYLDHTLATASAAAKVRGATVWHINADESSVLDYNTEFKPPVDLYSPDPYRASDHDPVIISLNDAPVLDPIGDQTVDELAILTFTAEAADIDGDDLAFSLDAGAPEGAAIDPTSGVFTWTPTEEQGPGVYPVTVRVSDGLASDFETLTITVNEVNMAPTAVDDSYDTAVNTVLTVTVELGVLANDSDADGNDLTAILQDEPASGDLALNADGSFTYTPETDFVGTVTFTYYANDGEVNSELAEVEIVVSEALAEEFFIYLPIVFAGE